MNQRERMLSGLPYKAWLDGLEEDRQACKQKIYDFNQLPPSRQSKEAPQMIKNIFGKTAIKLISMLPGASIENVRISLPQVIGLTTSSACSMPSMP